MNQSQKAWRPILTSSPPATAAHEHSSTPEETVYPLADACGEGSKSIVLPDFPKSRLELHKKLLLRIYLTAQAKSPLRALGRSVTQHEGILHSYEQITDTGIRSITEGMQEIAVPIEVKIEEVPELVGERLLQRVDGGWRRGDNGCRALCVWFIKAARFLRPPSSGGRFLTFPSLPCPSYQFRN